MRKILWILIFSMLLCQHQSYCADQWDKLEILGTRNASDIDYYMDINNEALDRLNYLNRVNCAVMANTSATLTVLPGTIAIPNVAGSIVRWRRESSSTTVTWSDLDTGSEAASTQYYVYASGDTDETGIDIKISASSTSPSGITYYRKIGYFYNNSDSDIVDVGNIKEGDCPNIMKATGTTDINTTSTTYTDMTDMSIRFVSNGRPVKVTFTAPIQAVSENDVQATIDIDGTNKIETFIRPGSGLEDILHLEWLETLSSGAHTIKVEWKISGSTLHQYGSTQGARILICEEM